MAENQENNTNQNIITVPIDIKAVKNGAFIWLGEFNLSYGDKMYYDVLAEKGNGLQTGFAAPEDDPLNRTYFTISNKREDGILDTKGDFIFAAPVKPGQYNLFIRATDGDLINVNGSITIEYTEPPTAIPKIPVDLNSSNKSEVSYEEAYVQWDVTYIDGIYYYKNEPVRVFMDLRADNSFTNFSYNKNGSVDLRLVRNSSDSIVKAEHMTKAEAEEILRDIEQDPPIDEDIKRLTPEEAPNDVRAAISSCDDKAWYVIEGHGRQYIYYNNLPHNYAYQYEPNQNSISIVDIGTSTGNCVLLSVPINSNLAISYNSETVTYTNVPQSNAKENITQPAGYVIECVSEEVVVKQGGTEFKLEIDKASQNNYTIRDNRNVPYGDRYYRYNKWDIVVERNKEADPSAVFSPTITLTIPKNIDEKSILLVTENGNIQVNGLNNVNLTVKTQSGEIDIEDTNATFISAESETGNVNMKNITSTGDIEADSESGSVSMQLGNSDSQYSMLINTESTAGITINGQKYDGGHYSVGNDAKQKVMLNGNSNSFVVSNIHLFNDSIIGVSSNINPQQSGQSSTDYWTIEEFITFMESQEQQCKKLLGNGNITQNEFDTFASVNKGVLKEIQNGAKVSKSATGSIGNGIGI